jgi:hypothetical protein
LPLAFLPQRQVEFEAGVEQDRLAKLEEVRSLEDEEDPGREAQVAELLEVLPVLPEGLSSAPE